MTDRNVMPSKDGDDFELPDPREVNRQISEEMRAARRAASSVNRNTGALARAAQKAQKRHPNDVIAQVIYLLMHEAWPASTGRRRSMSEGTQAGHKEGLLRAFRELKAMRMAVRNLDEFGRKHALALIRSWVAKGQSKKTIDNNVTNLRVFANLINKPRMVPRDGEYLDWLKSAGVVLPEQRVSGVALEPKTWSVKDVDPMEVIEKIREEYPVVAMCLEVMLAFGLRAAEATHLEPISCDLGHMLHIREGARGGAKGGKSRTIPFSDDPSLRVWQKDVLERAKALARKHRQLKLAVPGKNYQQMQSHFYYVCGKYGITRQGLGVLPHGLRHMYAGRRHRELTGLPAPVEGTVPMDVYRANLALIREGNQQVSLELGHVRPEITSAYNGSVHSQSKEEAARTRGWIENLEKCPGLKALLDSLDVRTLYLGGKAAQGVRMQVGDKLRLLVDRDVTQDQQLELEVLRRAVIKLLKLGDAMEAEVVHVSECDDDRDSYLELNVLG